MNDLMQKLAMSKKIMDKHNQVPRNQLNGLAMVNETNNATYNIPQELINESKTEGIKETISTNPITNDAVLNSKLPDEIKKLMIENPIVQPQLNGPTLSDEIIEGASRLMKTNRKNSNLSENTVQKTDTNNLKQMIRDVVRDTVRDTVRDVVKEELTSAGLISENTQRTNETLSLRVGKHIFEGRVTKIKKIKQ